MARSLFISYDGPTHDYLESLFVPVLGATHHEITVLEMCPAASSPAIEDRFRNHVVEVRTAPYRSGGLGPLTAAGALCSALRPALRLVRVVKPDIVHTRSYVPAVLGLALKLLRPSLRLVVDLDGWMPQERVDAGSWSRNGPMYRLFTSIERLAVTYGDIVVCRTQVHAERLRRGLGPSMAAKVRVVPNGVDPKLFRPVGSSERAALRGELSLPTDGPVLVHAGSFGELYAPTALFSLFELVLARQAKAWLLISTH